MQNIKEKRRKSSTKKGVKRKKDRERERKKSAQRRKAQSQTAVWRFQRTPVFDLSLWYLFVITIRVAYVCTVCVSLFFSFGMRSFKDILRKIFKVTFGICLLNMEERERKSDTTMRKMNKTKHTKWIEKNTSAQQHNVQPLMHSHRQCVERFLRNENQARLLVSVWH